MSVHVFGGGVSNNVSTPFNGATVYWCRKGIIYYKGNPMFVSNFCKKFNIQDGKCRIRNGFAEHNFGIWLESCVQFFFSSIWGNEGCGDSHFGHGNRDQVEGSAINGRRSHNVVSALTDIEQSHEIGCLSGRSEHSCSSTLHCSNLGCNMVAGRILKAGVEIPLSFKVEKFSHILAGVVFECC